MANDVVIRVTARNAVKEGFDLSKRDIRKFSEDAGDIFTLHFGRKIRQLGKQIEAPLSLAGKDMGKTIGNSISESMTENVTVNLKTKLKREFEKVGSDLGKTLGNSTSDSFNDEMIRKTQTITERIRQKIKTIIDRDSDTKTKGSSSHSSKSGGILDGDDSSKGGIFSRMRDYGKDLGDKISGGIGASLQTFFSGDLISLVVKALAGTALAMALAPVIGAAFTAAVGLALGGGVLAAGIIAAAKDPRIKGAFGDLKTKAKDIFTEFGKPFRAPIADFLEKLAGFLDRVAPKLKDLGNSFAPLLGQLGDGLIGLLENAMPGILKMVESSKPLFETLARHMPEIGKALNSFFTELSKHGDDAALFFGDVLHLVELIIKGVGKLMSIFASFYSVVRDYAKAVVGFFKQIGGAVKDSMSDAKTFVLRFVIVAIEWFNKLLEGAKKAFGWIPGVGDRLKTAQASFRTFRDRVNSELKGIHNKTVSVHINVTGYNVLRAGLDALRHLQSMNGGRRHGGIQGAASGGPRSNLTWVGENGPELVNLPPGSSVRTAGDSARIAQGMGGQGGETVVRLVADHATERSIIGVLFSMLRAEIARQGGNVQVVLGRS